LGAGHGRGGFGRDGDQPACRDLNFINRNGGAGDLLRRRRKITN
jgi:hypothetical protein